MIHTTARTRVFEVTFIPNGHSEPETNRHPVDDEALVGRDREIVVDILLNAYEPTGEVLSIIYVTADDKPVNLYGNRRYGL